MGVFHLDVSTLSGVNVTYRETPLQERGQTITVEWVQAGANQDIRLHGYAVRGVPGEIMEIDDPLPNVAVACESLFGTGTFGSDPFGTCVTGPSLYGMGLYGSGIYGRRSLTGLSFFILDTSVLGGSPAISSVHVPFQDRGRSVQLEWIQSGSNQDMRLHGYAIRGVPAEVMSMEQA